MDILENLVACLLWLLTPSNPYFFNFLLKKGEHTLKAPPMIWKFDGIGLVLL